MSSRLTTNGEAESRSSQSNSQRRHRSRSTSRYADLDKPKKKKTLSATTSLVSIPNTIKLSMLNSGLLSFEKVKLEARDQHNSLSQTIPDKPIELRHFVKLCDQRRKFPVLYKLEFQTAVKVETNTCRHATRKNNLEKNQNQKCIPYDYNRVVLEKLPGVPDSDYINASYVDSLLKPNAYIVTQGPTEETGNEFWRMIWQENVSAIVMLTKTFDFTKVMCVQYWPPNIEIHETYGDIYLNIVNEEQLANFQIRTFRLYKKNGEAITEERLILQFHYTEWHSHTCPFSNAVLEFRRRVRAVVGNIIKPNSIIGPMLVHCNDGGGRSGVYLAIDANLELAEEEDCFHVFGYLKKLRQSRKGLIENVDQYKFVYDTLEEHIVCGKTWFPVAELSERLKAKAKKDLVTKMNEYQREYAQICKQTPRFTIGDCAGGHRADNREKNRDVLCVPPDNFRPYLTSFQGNAFTDYINSVFVDGYTKPREYIVTEWPLKHTVGEFWSLVYDHECSAIVVLCQPPPNSQQYPSFWPQKSKQEKYGPVFSVHFVSGKHYQNIKQWEYKINKKIISLTEMMAGVKAPTKTIQLFQLTCWPMGHKVPTSTNSLVFLMNMVECWRQRTDYGPVCVVSPDGRSRAGVYCAANACIEQVIQHGEVDVFQAVKTVRRHRPQLIDNMTEYKYCYDLVLHYVLHFLDKDHKIKKFIAFGRGKCIPLTPDNLNVDLPSEISNTGRIIVNKCIDKIDKREAILLQAERDFLLQRNHLLDRNGKILERKKKGRLYSLGGNEPQRKGHRGRLDRLKTVGTFDLGTEMSVLSEVARNLNEKLITGELAMFHPIQLPDDYIRRNCITTPTTTHLSSSTIHSNSNLNNNNSNRNTPEFRKRDIIRSTSSARPDFKLPLKSPILYDTKFYGINNDLKSQHSADDCIHRNVVGINNNDKKSRSLSTSSYLNKDKLDNNNIIVIKQQTQNHLNNLKQKTFPDIDAIETIPHIDAIETIPHIDAIETIPHIDAIETIEDDAIINDLTKHSKKIDDDIISYEQQQQQQQLKREPSSQDFSYNNRKTMLRKSRRIVRTDSEIFNEGIICNSDRNEIILVNSSDIQIHTNPEDRCEREREIISQDSFRTSSITSSSICSRKDSSDFDDICSPKEPLKSTTDDSSKNISTDEMDAVFSDSTTDLERLEKEYKELLRTNLQREYKSDGDKLDEVGKKRNEFGMWKNQSLEHEFDYSTKDLNNIDEPITLSSQSSDIKDISRICSPESCTNGGAYSDSGVKNLNQKYSIFKKLRSRVYSSSRVGETPTEKQRLQQPIDNNERFLNSTINTKTSISDDGYNNIDSSSIHKIQIRPSILEIKNSTQQLQQPQPEQPQPQQQQQQQQQQPQILRNNSNEGGSISSFLEKPFGKFRKVNKLLKCKRFSTSTLYDKKKSSSTTLSQQNSDIKGSTKLLQKLNSNKKMNSTTNLTNKTKGTIHLSKLSLFNNQKSTSKSSSIFSCRKFGSGMFSSATSHSNNELFSKTTSKTKLSEISKSNTELNKYRTSPSRFSGRKSSTKHSNTPSYSNTDVLCHSPLSEEFYNKTGSVRLSAMELYEKFCSEDFGGLYKHENDERLDRRNQHEYRLEMKGLRTIGRYNKNARLLKQKSEPKFNFRSQQQHYYNDPIYHGQDEYYYNPDKINNYYGYYNEQDEYYDEYDDDDYYEGDYYEDEEEEEDEVDEEDVDADVDPNFYDDQQYNIDEQHLIMKMVAEANDHNDSTCYINQQIDEEDMNDIDVIDAENQAKLKRKNLEQMNTTCGGTDSDIDEILLMPDDYCGSTSLRSDYEEYGFENKQFSLEHSQYDNKINNYKKISLNSLNSKENLNDSIKNIQILSNKNDKNDDDIIDDVLTIYKFCSKEDIAKISIDMLVNDDKSSSSSQQRQRHQRSSSLKCDTIEQAVHTYIKQSTVDISLEPTTLKTDCIDIDRTDSLELLSNSSDTIRSRSTLTEYAFDTVKNLNLDSCSTSKLSLSLKSEIFDDFTITPDDIKPIPNNCDIEDFTLTPDDSVEEDQQQQQKDNDDEQLTNLLKHNNHNYNNNNNNNNNYDTTIDKSDDCYNEKSLIDDEYQNQVLVLVDKFLANERNLLPLKDNYDTIDDTCYINKDIKSDNNIIITEKSINSDDNDLLKESTSNDLTTTAADLTIIDLYDDEQPISLFTSELTKEFDRLFSKAEEQYDDDQSDFICGDDEPQPPPIHNTKIPSRYSMQKLEPYYIADDDDDNRINNDKNFDYKNLLDSYHDVPMAAITVPSGAVAVTTNLTRRNGGAGGGGGSSSSSSTHKKLSAHLKKTRSQSLGNINKKTKCFPL